MEGKISDCDWSYLKTLKTLREPAQSMPRLEDLLRYIASPRLEHIWILLDIKVRISMVTRDQLSWKERWHK